MAADQLDLLSDTPIARSTDPRSSHQAGAFITKTVRASQQARVLELVTASPGCTSAELAEQSGLDRYMIARRLPEIRPAHVLNGSPRDCRITKRRALTWYPAKGR